MGQARGTGGVPDALLDRVGGAKELWEAIAKQAGLAVEFREAGFDPESLKSITRPRKIFRRGGKVSLLDALEEIQPYAAGYILESDRIIILSGNEAQAFWREWWAAEKR